MPTKMLPIQQNQAWPPRAAMMENLVKAAFQSAVTALEIGVWFGIGSTNIWLENLKPGSTLFLLNSWKPFASQEDLKDEKVDYKGMDDLSTDAFLSAFLKVKKFETENKDRNIKIQMTRGASSSVLPLLKDDSFDLIYIDGDHKYENSKNDIAQAKRLVKKTFGIICGDDLEKLPTPELMAVSKNHKKISTICMNRTFSTLVCYWPLQKSFRR